MIFGVLLDKFPVTPYLDSRESFTKWVLFIHNQINKSIGKDEMLMSDAMKLYYQNYKPKTVTKREQGKIREKYIYGGFMIILIASIVFLYQK